MLTEPMPAEIGGPQGRHRDGKPISRNTRVDTDTVAAAHRLAVVLADMATTDQTRAYITGWTDALDELAPSPPS